ncbi:membrane fusion protein (multidrug efflux system) [Kerstersia gyiorum]|uniref:Membrane fusion protein (Multidrug efflux system) n=2 Tax=Kerstersia gyiorum TaxID=206506 RepID=A0A4V2EZ23_9BURK|nr:membrane fusion protein (multidrug efflux system) [Kerstersia gyiorum]
MINAKKIQYRVSMRAKPISFTAPRIVVTGAMLLLLAACGDKPQGAPQMQPEVKVVTAIQQRVPIISELPGRVDAVRDAQVRARVTGIVEKVNFEQGRDVKAGDLLFTIDRAQLQAVYNQANAQLKQAEAALLSARSLAQRYEPLVKVNAVSRQEYDNALSASREAEAAVVAAKAALESAAINLGYTKVTSPISGRIGEPLVTEGALVEGSTATHMATVQQLDPIYVDFNQSTADLAQLRKVFSHGKVQRVDEAPVTVMLDGQPYDQKGRLLFTGVTVDPSTGQVKLRAEVPNPHSELLPGMFVRVKLEQGYDENAVLVPQQALQRAVDGSASVFLLRDGDTIAVAPVKVGIAYQGQWVIQEGVSAGDVVVVEGFQKIGPGAKVKAHPWKQQEEGAAPAAAAAPAEAK